MGGKNAVLRVGRTNDLCTVLPEKPRLARSFEDLPGEVRSALIYRFISVRLHFEQRENFLAEV
jgi:hypothetical protein